MVKKNTSSHEFGVLGIVALVAIVAVVALMGGSPAAPSQGVSLDGDTLVGSARYRLIDDVAVARGDGLQTCRYSHPDRARYKLYTIPAGEDCPEFYPGDSSYRFVDSVVDETVQERSDAFVLDERFEETFDMSRYVDENQFMEYESESLTSLDTIDIAMSIDLSTFISSAVTPNWENVPVAGLESCFTLTSSMFNGPNGTNYTINQTGMCFNLAGDVNVGSGNLIVASDVQLDCQNNELLGTGTVIVKDSGIVENCIVSNRNFWNAPIVSGFVLYDSAQVFNSESNNHLHGYGFVLYDNSLVATSVAQGNSHTGFWLFGSSRVQDSSSLNNGHGFIVEGNAIVEDAYASGSRINYRLQNQFQSTNAYPIVRSSISAGTGSYSINTPNGIINRARGFLVNLGAVENSQSLDSEGHGFELWSGQVHGSIAKDSALSGFFIRSSGRVVGSESIENGIEGFVLKDASSVALSSAVNNGANGFLILSPGVYLGNQLIARGNAQHGLLVSSGVSVNTQGKFCDNVVGDVLANCAFQGGTLSCGGVNGRLTADNYVLGNGNAQILPCSQVIDSPIMAQE